MGELSNRTMSLSPPQDPQYLQYTHHTQLIHTHTHTHTHTYRCGWMVGVVQAVLYGGVMLCRVVSPHYDDWYCREIWSPRKFVPPGYKWVALLTFLPSPLLFSPFLLWPHLSFPPSLFCDLLILSPVSLVVPHILLGHTDQYVHQMAMCRAGGLGFWDRMHLRRLNS